MSAMTMRSMGVASVRSAGVLFRQRLTSRSDVKRAQRACRSQNRMLMREGRASLSPGRPKTGCSPLGGRRAAPWGHT